MVRCAAEFSLGIEAGVEQLVGTAPVRGESRIRSAAK
jgi:hypothetical protein